MVDCRWEVVYKKKRQKTTKGAKAQARIEIGNCVGMNGGYCG